MFLTSLLHLQINSISKWSNDFKKNYALKEIRDGLTTYIKQLMKMKSGVKRAKALHNKIDELNVRAAKGRDMSDVSCRKGCSYCCHQLQIVNNDEAKLLANEMKKLDIDWERFNEQSKWVPKDKSNYELEWFKQPPEKSMCVFLGEDKTCRVYENRPTSCRNYQVINDPADCSYEKAGGEAKQIFFLNSQILASASLNLEKKDRAVGSDAGFLPAMVRKYI